MVDKNSILKINSVAVLESLNLKASASNVYTNQEIHNNAIIYASALNSQADNSTRYTKTELRAFIETQYTFAAPFTRTVDVTTGIFTLGGNSNTHISHTFTDSIDIQPPSQYGGSIRIIPALNKNEASIGYYN